MIHPGPFTTLSGRELTKTFGHGARALRVLDGLDLDLPRGGFSLVKGPSGCGKSTLLAVLAGLTPPDSGTVSALGSPLWAMNNAARDAFRLAHMGFIFQGSILFPALTAREQIELVLGYGGVGRDAARDRALRALDDVGLAARAHLRPDALSGGEKQRVAIACALAKQPQLIFADEPTSALDSENSELVSALLRRLSRDHGATVLCVTHDDRLTPWVDRIFHMRAGRIAGVEIGGSA
ncbi:ABC transporter ATP-binding protein [Paracoccus sp. (in: a-proteobacteria)]|uniref:ABC transporter ATP-binding protein n=1 Tax=Paracoccus sp. TaxID=267 RepID=UPI0026DEA482|nr:ABC transporter ATP-binding protein [Paracoccus sp. (in: a-proteobacteria)]MDO5647247.1 ABC transporter ATP-binding protein [Paracoccus sp. (in: a-proteobacteria)]